MAQVAYEISSDGAASIAILRQRFPQAKVLAISGQFAPGLHGTTAGAIELGADAVLAKPFAAKVFIDAVREGWGRDSRMLRSAPRGWRAPVNHHKCDPLHCDPSPGSRRRSRPCTNERE